MAKESLMAFIQKKSEEILQHVEGPEELHAYLFWKIMETLCDHDGVRIVVCELVAVETCSCRDVAVL